MHIPHTTNSSAFVWFLRNAQNCEKQPDLKWFQSIRCSRQIFFHITSSDTTLWNSLYYVIWDNEDNVQGYVRVLMFKIKEGQAQQKNRISKAKAPFTRLRSRSLFLTVLICYLYFLLVQPCNERVQTEKKGRTCRLISCSFFCKFNQFGRCNLAGSWKGFPNSLINDCVFSPFSYFFLVRRRSSPFAPGSLARL